MAAGSRTWRALAAPVRALLDGLDACLRTHLDLLWVFVGLGVGWWFYVPVHELLHAAGCVVTGGTVSRLEIDALYGGALWAQVFPFVVADSAYAGRLSGFDTRGSDLTYLATVAAPFVLTFVPGLWGLRRAVATRRPMLYGLALPCAFAPFLSLTCDAYEIGSIVITRLAPWSLTATSALLRGDDLGLRVEALQAAGPNAPWAGLVLSAALGLLWAFLTWTLANAAAAWVAGDRVAGDRVAGDRNAAA